VEGPSEVAGPRRTPDADDPHDLVVTARLPRLDRLTGRDGPCLAVASGPRIRHRAGEHLHWDLGATLEELEAAAHEGPPAEIAGGWGEEGWQGS